MGISRKQRSQLTPEQVYEQECRKSQRLRTHPFIYSDSFNDAVSISYYTASDGRMIGELEMVSKEAIVTKPHTVQGILDGGLNKTMKTLSEDSPLACQEVN
jgi:hypothetical protein